MSDQNNGYQGGCYCGAVSVSVKGEPVIAGYCHCHSCRKWHAAPVNAWAAWPAAMVEFSGELLQSTHNSGSQRISCARCGGNIANGKPALDLMVVYPMTLAESDYQFTPAFHIFYSERVVDMADGLPKFVDASKEAGFSGEMMAESGDTQWCG